VTSHDRSEGGFTLIELLVAMTLTVLILAAVATSLIVTSGNYTASATRLIQSHNAQLLSSWLVADVASAGPNATDVDTAKTTSTTGCNGSVVSDGTHVNILKLAWSDFDTGTAYAAAYRLEGSELVRYFCTSGSGPSLTVVGRNVTSAAATVTAQEINVAVSVPVDSQPYSFNVSASRRTKNVPLATTTLPPATTTLPPTTTTTLPPTTTTTTAGP
jgi:prepilin-type N-terminal cleavage/methylation domain-containing protein